MPANVRRQISNDPCPDCNGVGSIHLKAGETGDPGYDLYHLGYKKCERCGGTGELVSQSKK